MPRTIALTIFILFISTMSLAQSGPQLNRDPATVKWALLIGLGATNVMVYWGIISAQTCSCSTPIRFNQSLICQLLKRTHQEVVVII